VFRQIWEEGWSGVGGRGVVGQRYYSRDAAKRSGTHLGDGSRISGLELPQWDLFFVGRSLNFGLIDARSIHSKNKQNIYFVSRPPSFSSSVVGNDGEAWCPMVVKPSFILRESFDTPADISYKASKIDLATDPPCHSRAVCCSTALSFWLC